MTLTVNAVRLETLMRKQDREWHRVRKSDVLGVYDHCRNLASALSFAGVAIVALTKEIDRLKADGANVPVEAIALLDQLRAVLVDARAA